MLAEPNKSNQDWRISLIVTQRVKGRYPRNIGRVVDVFPEGTAGIDDPEGVLAVELRTIGKEEEPTLIVLSPASDWSSCGKTPGKDRPGR